MQIVINTVMPIVTIIAVIVITRRKRMQEQGQWEAYKRRKSHNRHVWLSSNFLTRNKYSRVVMQYSTLACYNVFEVEEKSTKVFIQSVATAVLIPVAVTIALKDMLLGAFSVVVGMLYYEITIASAIDKAYSECIQEASIAIQSIRKQYKDCNNIPEAFTKCDKGKLLSQPITEIYRMLVSVDSEGALNQYLRKAPIRILKTLAMVSYIFNVRGDSRGENNKSAYADLLTSLRQEADMEVRRLNAVKIAFKSLPKLALVGLVLMPLADIFLMGQIPGTVTLIKGMYGYVEKMAIIGITALAYHKINAYTRPTVVNVVDKSQTIDTLSKMQWMQRILKSVMPKKFKTRKALRLRMEGAITSKSVPYIYTAKIVYSLSAALIAFVCTICFTISVKSYVWNTHVNLGFIQSKLDISEKAQERLYAIDEYYMTLPEKMTDEEAAKYIKRHVPELRTMEAQNQAERLSKKWDTYYSIKWSWKFMFIVVLAGVVGWFAPELSLRSRKRLVQFEEVEDVMQLQTLMIALAETTMTVGEVLYWLEKQSTLHKAVLCRAVMSYDSNPELALSRLKTAVHSPDLKRLVSGLMVAVQTMPLKEAFGDTILDRDQLMRLREMAQNEVIESKKQDARLFAMAPAGCVLIFSFVGPVLVLGFSEIIKIFSNMS